MSYSVALYLTESPAKNKYSSLLGQFVTYKENKLLWIQPQGQYSQHFIFIVTYKLPNKLECYIT